jgi:hypothetical protein
LAVKSAAFVLFRNNRLRPNCKPKLPAAVVSKQLAVEPVKPDLSTITTRDQEGLQRCTRWLYNKIAGVRHSADCGGATICREWGELKKQYLAGDRAYGWLNRDRAGLRQCMDLEARECERIAAAAFVLPL